MFEYQDTTRVVGSDPSTHHAGHRLIALTGLALAVSLAIAGCNSAGTSTAPTASDAADQTLVAVKASSQPGSCVSGAVDVTAGFDLNGDGTLQDTENSFTETVCLSAANGANSLVSMVNESAGANCAAGGKKVMVGPDSNLNGQLDAAEVATTGYVCNGVAGATGATGPQGPAGADGADGANGAQGAQGPAGPQGAQGIPGVAGTNGTNGTNGSDGKNSLVKISVEAAGANCTYGGNKIETGVDTSGNNVLEAGEVTQTAYVCNAARAGLPWITTATAVTALADTGYIVTGGSVTTVTLPDNPAVGSVVRINGTGAGGWKLGQQANQIVKMPTEIGPIALNQPWTDIAPGGSERIASSYDGTKLLQPRGTDGLFRSTDSGSSWTQLTNGLPVGAEFRGVHSSHDGTRLVAMVNGDQIYTSSDSGTNWTARDSARAWYVVSGSSDGKYLLAVESTGWGVYRSADFGATWASTGISIGSVLATPGVSPDGRYMLVGGWNCCGNTHKWSNDYGATWVNASQANQSASNLTALNAITFAGNKVLAGSIWNPMWRSDDFGASLYQIANPGFRFSNNGLDADINGQVLIATGENNDVTWTSHDGGTTWRPRTSPGGSWYYGRVSPDGKKMFAQYNNRLYSAPGMSQTLTGPTGYIQGPQYSGIEVQYVGSNVWAVISHAGLEKM